LGHLTWLTFNLKKKKKKERKSEKDTVRVSMVK
jgi:hypothetical protein